jgi:hypothetical protein
MKPVLAVLLFLSSTAVWSAENLPATGSSSTVSGSSGSSTVAAESAPVPVPKSVRTAVTPAFKADLAFCRTLVAEERRNCERETYAARNEGLYR